MSNSPNRNSISLEKNNIQFQGTQLNAAPFFKPLKLANPSVRVRHQSKPSQNRVSVADASTKRNDKGNFPPPKDHLQDSAEVVRIKKTRDEKRISKENIENPTNIISKSDKALVVNILKKDPSNRSDGEVVFLQQILRNLKFFSQAEEEIHTQLLRDLLRYLKMETFETGQHVFDYGDVGKKFYIIIQGSAYVLIKSRGIFKDLDELNSPRRSRKITEDEFKLFMQRDMGEDVRTKRLELYYPGFTVARSLNAGESFGEIALKSDGSRKRTATIVCKEETTVGVVSLEDYQTYLEQLHEKKQEELTALLSNLHLFKHWSKTQILELLPHVEDTVYLRNQTVFKEGDEPNKVYFIMQGEIELWKKVELEDNSSKMLSPKSAASPFRSKTLKRKKDIRLALICSGEYIGASGLIDKKLRDHSAIISSSEARLISLTREKFTMFVSDDRSIASLTIYVERKEIWREKVATNCLNIASIYEHTYESPEKSKATSPTSFFPNISPTNDNTEESTNFEQVSTQKKIDRMLRPSRSSLRPVLNFMERSPHSVKKLSTGFTPINISSSPMNSTPTALLNRRPVTRDADKLQIVSFDQKSSIKKKIELDVAFSKLQKRLNKLLEEEEEEAKLTSQPDQPYSPKEKNIPEDFYFNFTKKGAPVDNPTTKNLKPEHLVALQSNIDTELIPRESKQLRELKKSNSAAKLPSQKGPKFKIVKKVGIDRIYFDQGERASTFLQTYMTFVNDAIEGRENWSTSPPLRIYSRPSQSPPPNQLIIKKELHKRDIQTSSMGFSLAKPQTQQGQEKPSMDRLLTTNISKRLYGKVQRTIENE